MAEFSIRNMKANELEVAVQWAKNEGWNPGLNDARHFFEADPNGFFLGELGGEIIAVGAAVAYDDKFGFCGLYIVSPEHRGKGYGMALTEARLKYLDGRNVGIDGVLENVKIYERIGYVPYYHHRRFEFTAKKISSQNPLVIPFTEDALEAVVGYDQRCFPAVREKFLKSWLNQSPGKVLVYKEGDEIKGFGVRRPCFEGHKVGPLFADDPEIACELLSALCQDVEGDSLYLDCPDNHEGPKLLQDRFSMNETFVVARMYRKGLPETEEQKIFGICTMELG